MLFAAFVALSLTVWADDWQLCWLNPCVWALSDDFSNFRIFRSVSWMRLTWLAALAGVWAVSYLCIRQYGKGVLGSLAASTRRIYRPAIALLLLFCSCWPAGRGRCSPSAKSMRPSPQTPLTPAGQVSPAWSTSSGASWGPGSSRRCGATVTNLFPQAPHQNKASAQRIFFRCALLLFLTPVMRLRHIRLLLVFAVFFRYFGRLLQAFLAVINRLIANRIQQNALQMLKF